jgi:hypothetical protein
MKKEKIIILDVDRKLTDKEHPVKNIFQPYDVLGVGVVLFSYKSEQPPRMEAVLLRPISLGADMEKLFPGVLIDDEEDFPDFEIKDMDKDTFFDVLSQKYEIEVKSFSQEKPVCSKCNKPLSKDDIRTHNFADMMYGADEMICYGCSEVSEKSERSKT